MKDLRCDNKKHGVLLPNNIVEFKCSSRFCGASSDTVVLHYFALNDGEMVATRKFKNPNLKGK